jgi:hypothetical protein
MLKVLLQLPRRNTDALIGAVAAELESEGIQLVDSTCFLQDHLPEEGVLTRRKPDAREHEDIAYGLEVAREISRLDLGQTIVVRGKACVAIEAMEGTDATIRRAGDLMSGRGQTSQQETRSDAEGSAPKKSRISGIVSSLIRGPKPDLSAGRLTVVKVAKPDQDMRFDVPVVGASTVEAMIDAGATCLCLTAGKTLLFDRDEMLALANENQIAIIAVP